MLQTDIYVDEVVASQQVSRVYSKCKRQYAVNKLSFLTKPEVRMEITAN